MAGSPLPRFKSGRVAAVLTASLLTFTGVAQAQNPAPVPQPAAAAAPTYYGGGVLTPAAPQAGMGVFGTITESLFGDAPAENWRPLTLGGFFSEGWLEPWVGGPAGQTGLTPRHGWLGAFEGVFYRLWLMNGTYQNSLNRPYGGNAYSGNFAAFLPFSRRFELYLSVPYISANGTEEDGRGYRSDFGDISLAGSFLLSESCACTQLFTLGAILPTGESETGGNQMALFPRYSFWSNPAGAWVVRGGTGVNIPLNKNDNRPAPTILPSGDLVFGESSAQTTWNGALAVGRYFRPHNVPFGDLVFYVNCNIVVPFEDLAQPTYFGVGPGTRFQIGGDWYFLNYWEFQVGNDRPYDFQIQAAIVKAF